MLHEFLFLMCPFDHPLQVLAAAARSLLRMLAGGSAEEMEASAAAAAAALAAYGGSGGPSACASAGQAVHDALLRCVGAGAAGAEFATFDPVQRSGAMNAVTLLPGLAHGARTPAPGTEAAAAAATHGGRSSARAVASALLPPPRVSQLNDECSQLVVDLLSAAQSALGLGVLSLDHYSALLVPLRPAFRRAVAGQLLGTVLSAGTPVGSPAVARRLLASLLPLIVPGEEEVTAAAAAAGAVGGAASSHRHGHHGGNGGAAAAGLSHPNRAGHYVNASPTSSSSSSGAAADDSGTVHLSLAKLVHLLGASTDAGVCAAAAAAAGAGGAAVEAATAATAAASAISAADVPSSSSSSSFAQPTKHAAGVPPSVADIDTDAHFEVYRVAVGYFAAAGGTVQAAATREGGADGPSVRRIGAVFPAIVCGALALARRVRVREAMAAAAVGASALSRGGAAQPPIDSSSGSSSSSSSARRGSSGSDPTLTYLSQSLPPLKVPSARVYAFVQEVLAALAGTGAHSDLALRLYLTAAAAASHAPDLAEGFFSHGEGFFSHG